MKLIWPNIKKIIIALITIGWGAALFFYGPFYARGYPIKPSIGILVMIIGFFYLALEMLKNKKRLE